MRGYTVVDGALSFEGTGPTGEPGEVVYYASNGGGLKDDHAGLCAVVEDADFVSFPDPSPTT